MKRMRRSSALKFKLRGLDTLLIAGVSLLMVVVLILFSEYTTNVKISENQLVSLVLERMSKNQKTHFEQYIDEKIQTLRALAEFPQVYNVEDTEIRDFLKGHAKTFGFQYFFLMKSDGTGYYFDEGEIYRHQKDEPFFQSIMEHDVFLTEPYYSDKSPAITTICVSIYDKHQQKVGVLCGALNLDSIQTYIKNSEMILNGSCLLLNETGSCIAANIDYNIHDESSNFFEIPDSNLDLIKTAFSTHTDQSGTLRVSGAKHRAHVTYLSDFNWVIVQSIPIVELNARFQYIQVLQIIMTILSFLLILCIIRIFHRWRTSDKKVYTDILTGCHSRAACLSLFASLSSKKNKRISIIYMDLNKFKFVNDTYGHDEGDRLLRIFGKTLKRVFGNMGFVGRLGGDEFVTVLTNVSDSEIETLCAEVDAILEKRSADLPFPYTISTSYGYASREIGHADPLEELLQKADERMYQQKADKHENR